MTKWDKSSPSTDGTLWCWVKYKGKNGIVKCPAYVCHIGRANSAEYILATARNDVFIKRHGKDSWEYDGKAVKSLYFGPIIEEPQG